MNERKDDKLPLVMCYSCGVHTAFPKKVGSMDYCLHCWADESPEFLKWADANYKEEMKKIRIVVNENEPKFHLHLLPPDDATNGEN